MHSETRFQWHADATVHAQGQCIRPADGPPQTGIADRPSGRALGLLGATLGRDRGFCVSSSGGTLPDIPADHFVTLTGGTSGAPRQVLRTQASWIASFRANAAAFSYTSHDHIATLGRLSHSLTLYAALEALHLGLAYSALDGDKPAAQAAALRKSGVSVLYATPTQLRLLLADGPALPDLRLVLCGGGALDAPTREAMAKACPKAECLVFYGAAETSFITICDTTTPAASVGRAYDGVALDIRDGIIWVRSPYVFERYLTGTNPHTRRDADGWLSLGESGRLDAQGNLFLRGRAGRMITVADQNLFLDEIDRFLADKTDIPPCVAIAEDDSKRGARVSLVVESRADTALEAELRAECRTAFGAHAVPHRILFVDALPLLDSGKPDLTATADLARATT
ncbi:AMP-binding protein [Sulfitobacter sp. S190]|uniref:AMP-binding protein n=1 Tax=Sulfitobacter sp. S190 TaxID=2867022 RepID=UPI0021A3AE96|nr:AMP-binding protein [Sulfitobacter sp. S190]UWR22818.1 AMP-binding protein [Sulfitobacter sp. S190]